MHADFGSTNNSLILFAAFLVAVYLFIAVEVARLYSMTVALAMLLIPMIAALLLFPTFTYPMPSASDVIALVDTILHPYQPWTVP